MDDASGTNPGRRDEPPEDLAVVVDTDGTITAWDGDARELLGFEPEAMPGRLLADEPPGLTGTDAWTGDVALRHRDGHRVVLRLRARPLKDSDGKTVWLLTRPPDTEAARGQTAGAEAARGETASTEAARAEAGERAGAQAWAAAPRAQAGPLWNETLAQLPLGVAVYDHEGRLVGANQAMVSQMGLTESEMLGRSLWEMAPYPPFDELDRLQQQVLDSGETVFHQLYGRSPTATREQSWSIFLFPVRDADGAVRGVSAAVFDSTEQYWARRRLVVLNEASARIGSTLNVTTTAEELAEVATGGLADFVTVDLLESVFRGDEPEPMPTTGPVVFRRSAQRSVLRGCPEAVVKPGEPDVYAPGSSPVQALASGRATRHNIDDPAMRSWVLASPARTETVRRFNIHSALLVPLRARGITLGMVHMLRHRTQEGFTEDDLLLAEEIVARAAVSVDNARRFTRERRTALTLQRSLLPERPPGPAALEVAYRYLPADAGTGTGIGGDWFDVIPLSGARVALVVGDVVGHGVHASATMGRLRTAVRTLADVDLAPDELLTRLDDLVVRLDREEGPDVRGPGGAMGEVGATCLYAVYDPASRTCSMARAGHPPPAVVAPDGGVRFLSLPAGPPLGLGGLPFESREIELAEGSLLALYTDGLVEGVDRDIDIGMERLRRALTEPGRSLDDMCDAVLNNVLKDRPADDIVLLMARTSALDAGHIRTWELPSDPAAVPQARRLAGEQVADWGLGDLAFATELIVSELVTNAIRYGGAPIRLRLIRHDTLICEVSDGSSAAPHLRRARAFDEGGRGLLLVAQIAERWGSRQTPSGKTIWAEQPLPG
ncbi:SpoIIE family protein phosphatase [Streptomyces cavernae]|uniref:SpoIIE family protein phosphatase n=1 Tax=Streptomyces cavernae TaxID=2259034 RepID=UPI000FEB8ADC|nr:SpoIIE family protein phosphatase [Streptomyces cavernae]